MLKILIVEDDLMIADQIEEFLVQQGFDVCGIARTVQAGVDLAHLHMPDLLLLDLRLAEGGLGTSVAARLLPFGKLGILYATANSESSLLTAADGHACLSKPYTPSELLRGLELVTAIASSGPVTYPFPKGFKMLPAPGPHSEIRPT